MSHAMSKTFFFKKITDSKNLQPLLYGKAILPLSDPSSRSFQNRYNDIYEINKNNSTTEVSAD